MMDPFRAAAEQAVALLWRVENGDAEWRDVIAAIRDLERMVRSIRITPWRRAVLQSLEAAELAGGNWDAARVAHHLRVAMRQAPS